MKRFGTRLYKLSTVPDMPRQRSYFNEQETEMRDRRFAGEKTKVNVKTIFSKKENPLRQFLSYILVKTYKYILFCLLNISRL